MDERKNGKINGDGNTLPVHHRFRDGRNTKLSPERHGLICEKLRNGQSLTAAASLAGIARSTLTLWLRKGREGEPGYAEFYNDLCLAVADFEEEAIGSIRKAGGKGNWQAYAWMMERKHPELWGRRTVTRHEGHDGGPIEFSLNLSIDDREIVGVIDAEVVDDD